ncbi:hypothetical protein AU252_05075 [Pseudarthrobacter sulfonivorans]|uniref:Uncharacterized protein n=1 Tax=Pseudarthrobacter sulfonivorans TaxID=121292 RepID=A0A0U3QGH6_9MICC|nr:hypothetical protein [Pseudarthrobacter sulfonivorans]ALV40619.1 hypothetical protein AU252_05075 [Pseudarthrobacter sulfonivorans]
MTGRAVSVVVLLAVEAVLALLAVLVHSGFMAVYGRVADTAFEGLAWGLTAGPSGMALGPVAVVAVVGLVLSPRLWMRLTAVAIPVLMLLVMLAVTPLALGQKIGKYDSSPQCVIEGMDEPMASADRESQRAFDSIEHIGLYSGGGMSGVGGCSRGFAISEDVDVLQHYRSALPEAGWEVVEDDGRHLRAHHEGLAFEVMPCPGGGIVWAGSEDDPAYGQGIPGLAGTEICPHDL